ncbi:hypothetical protein [Acinetobacter calcoaceticus]|uniref:hypothetical protein n=1 Tax=Acinetobacter calcoaceticus TaxID=471 RepID=UPI003A84CCAE
MMVSFWSSIYQLRPTRGVLLFVIYNLISPFSNVNQPYIYYRGWRQGCRRFDAVARTYRHRNKGFWLLF